MSFYTKKRTDKLNDLFKEKSIDAIIITDRANVKYFSGFSGSAGYLFISGDKKILVTDFRYLSQAKEEAKGFEICNILDFDLKSASMGKTLGFENMSISYREFESISKKVKSLKGVDDALVDFRSVKEKEEIESVEIASSIADKAFNHIIGYIKEGMSEKQIALELEFFMRNNGAEGISFDTIVASGKRGAYPHAKPTDNKVKKGQLIVMDYGCIYNGYCSDMTRTVALGEIDDFSYNVYQNVLKVQKECLKMVKPGAVCMDIHNYSYKALNNLYKDCYGHGKNKSKNTYSWKHYNC